MRIGKIAKYISVFVLVVSMLWVSVLPAMATETLRASDMLIEMKIYSAKAEGMFNGRFFHKNNSLYVDAATIEKLAELKVEKDVNGTLLRVERADEPKAEYIVSDYATATFEGEVFYLFVEAMTDLCINVLYHAEQDCLYVIPAKSIWAISDKLEAMLENRTYSMSYWRSAATYDAETSRFVAQATDIGRNLFTLPSTMYKYLSGNADYESYRTALWDVMLAQVDSGVSATDSFAQELKVYKYLDFMKEFPKEGTSWGKLRGASRLMGQAAAAINDAGTVMQVEDYSAAVKFYYNLDNMNESVSNGITLIERTGLAENTNFNKAVKDTVLFYGGNKSLSDVLLENMDQGVVEYALNQIPYGFNATLGQTFSLCFDDIAKELSENGYAREQLDGIIKATSNLELQDAAKRSYQYYARLYSSTKNMPKKVSALNNMKDTMLVYMLAGHNAWKAVEFDQDLKAASVAGTKEMTEHISYLLGFGEEDFNVYQNAMNTKYTILANQANREQKHYFLDWNAAKAQEVGGVELTLEGCDDKNKGLLHKYMFNHQYFQQNGMLVGNIYQTAADKDSARVEYYQIQGVTELVIRPGNANTSIEQVEMQLAEGIRSETTAVDLSGYLVTEQDGTKIYRIPLPVGSGVSTGTALSTQTISAMTQPGGSSEEIPENPEESEDGIVYQQIDYTATPPFDGEYTMEMKDGYYTFHYNTQMLYVAGLNDPWTPYMGFAAHKDNMFVEYVCQAYLTDETPQMYYEDTKKNFTQRKNYKNVSFGDMKYLKAGEYTVAYFDWENTFLNNHNHLTYFQVELSPSVSLRGHWNKDINASEALTFEEFIIEAFSNFETPYGEE
ncbi:MAG: hypothetical protein IJN16_00825 [Lachnospiraceae bacterium]|nr:hypothetical protein [Lachnospiraceae bacterium]